MTIQLKGITEIRSGKFVVSYTKTSCCGCSTTRHTLVMDQKKKPTEAQAKKRIDDELKN